MVAALIIGGSGNMKMGNKKDTHSSREARHVNEYGE